jgi:hypothetical protein
MLYCTCTQWKLARVVILKQRTSDAPFLRVIDDHPPCAAAGGHGCRHRSPLAWAAARFVSSMLFGLKPTDLWTIGAATVVVIAAGLAAGFLRIHWKSPDHLVVDFPAPARVFQQRTSANGVRISCHPYDIR